jgi:hypothetical protein
MNALLQLLPAWKDFLPARRMRLKRRQWGFVRYEAPRRPGSPEPKADAHARFEDAARHAKREALMV